MNIRLWILFFFLGICAQINAQEKNIDAFYNLFEEIEFDVLPVYTYMRHPEMFQETNPYLFKGEKLDTVYYELLVDVLESIDTELKYSSLFALRRFYLTSQLEVLLIREYHDGGSEHHIHYVLFDNQKRSLLNTYKLAYSYGYEGGSGNTESWLLDINEDGFKDILTRHWTESYSGPDANYYFEDTFRVLLWKEDAFLEIPIDDPALEKQLIQDFPFHLEPGLSYQTGKKFFDYLNKTEGIEIPKYKGENWCIIAGADVDLPAAKHEEKRVIEIFGYDYKYGIDARMFIIHQKDGKYYTLIKGFENRNEAEIALIEIKKRFNKTAYIRNYKEWCAKPEYKKGYYYKCKD